MCVQRELEAESAPVESPTSQWAVARTRRSERGPTPNGKRTDGHYLERVYLERVYLPQFYTLREKGPPASTPKLLLEVIRRCKQAGRWLCARMNRRRSSAGCAGEMKTTARSCSRAPAAAPPSRKCGSGSTPTLPRGASFSSSQHSLLRRSLFAPPVFYISRDYPGILIVLISFWSGMG